MHWDSNGVLSVLVKWVLFHSAVLFDLAFIYYDI
jgi:hypothetical protein